MDLITILLHLVLISGFVNTRRYVQPQHISPFIVSKDLGIKRIKKFSDNDIQQFAEYTQMGSSNNNQDEVKQIDKNLERFGTRVEQLSRIVDNSIHRLQNSVQSTKKHRRPLIKLDMSSITPSNTITVQRTSDGSLQPVYNTASNVLDKPEPSLRAGDSIFNNTPKKVAKSIKISQEKFSKDTSSLTTKKNLLKSDTSKSTGRGKRGTDRIIFPSELEAYTRKPTRKPMPEATQVRFSDGKFVPKGCVGGGPICSSMNDYPTEYVNQVVAENQAQFQYFFGEDIVPEVVQRVDYPDEQSLCLSTEKVIFPTMGQTKDNKWAYIINNGNFSQGVRVEQCLQEDKPCAMTDSFPFGYTTQCRQKFIYRHLLALDENGNTVKNLFRLPACCKCVVTSRFGSGIFKRNAEMDGSSTSITPKE